jgi:thioesterase domain-containing protein
LLAPRWCCYGLAQDERDPAETITGLAAVYVERIREVQPRGPYWLTGWSFGAAVAYEMALLLEAGGERVARLTVLDPPPLFGRDSGRTVLAHHIAALPGGPPPADAAAAVTAAQALPLAQRATRLAHRLGLDSPDRDATERALLSRQLGTLLGNHELLASWQPTATVEKIHIVRPSAGGRPPAGGDDEWRPLARVEAAVTVVPGDHSSMMGRPCLGGVAGLFSRGAPGSGSTR